MIGVLGHDSALVRLYWAGDNLGESYLLRTSYGDTVPMLQLRSQFQYLVCFVQYFLQYPLHLTHVLGGQLGPVGVMITYNLFILKHKTEKMLKQAKGVVWLKKEGGGGVRRIKVVKGIEIK